MDGHQRGKSKCLKILLQIKVASQAIEVSCAITRDNWTRETIGYIETNETPGP